MRMRLTIIAANNTIGKPSLETCAPTHEPAPPKSCRSFADLPAETARDTITLSLK
jgi:hypothetical protein